jgi:hypothetical protein
MTQRPAGARPGGPRQARADGNAETAEWQAVSLALAGASPDAVVICEAAAGPSASTRRPPAAR